ncbi:3-ketosteroid reductase [Tricladium varicosporioides]|nr:3-ketosteroid reductase [Hymenoscyphus varicosporioides]
MGLPPWETSDSQLFALITGANSGLGYAVASRMIDEFFTSPSTSPKKHLILILCTRSPLKTRFTISNLRAHLRKLVDYSAFATRQRQQAKAAGTEYRWEHMVQRVHFIGVEVDLCDLRSVYKLADRLVNGTVGSPDATTYDGTRLPHGSPGTGSYSKDIQQDRWALSTEIGTSGFSRSWGWGLSGIKIPRLDVVILSAGMGGWIGVNWIPAIWAVIVDTVEAVSRPKFKIPNTGALAKSQSSFQRYNSQDDEATQQLLSEQKKPDEPPLGEVFCSNVFGHYILTHELMPLLSHPSTPTSQVGGKIMWVSSLEAAADHLKLDDIQGLQSQTPYEDTKRLIEIMALTSELPSVKRVIEPYFDVENTTTWKSPSEEKVVRPRLYVTHPGIFASEIMPLNSFFVAVYKLVFLVARWLGSPYHPIQPYKAAVAPVWLSLLETEELEELEGHGSHKAKWGSATDVSGNEKVMKTEVAGWGWDGTVGEVKGEKKIGRARGAIDATKESIEDFEVTGAKAWKKLEDLREEWEGVLGMR